MGANFDYEVLKDQRLELTDEEIAKHAEEMFEHSAYQNGHGGYSGTLAEKTGEGVTIHREKTFVTDMEARNYAIDTLDSDKWGPADVLPIEGVGWFIGGFCSS